MKTTKVSNMYPVMFLFLLLIMGNPKPNISGQGTSKTELQIIQDSTRMNIVKHFLNLDLIIEAQKNNQ